MYFTANLPSPRRAAAVLGFARFSRRAPQRVTTGAGWHSIAMSKDARLFVDVFSNVNTPRNVTLRTAGGRLLSAMLPNRLDASHPYAPFIDEHVRAEFGTIAAADGQAMQYKLLKPRNLEARQTLSGDRRRVRRSGRATRHQHLGQACSINTSCSRATWCSSSTIAAAACAARVSKRRWADRMGHVEVQDQVKGVEFLRSLPFVDGKRIGIFGWSYGGYMTLMCLMQAPDAFAAGVAGAPVTDWALYDTHYTERYLSTPRPNPEGYRQSNVLEYAKDLKRPLLLVHGMADDNVLFAHSTALMKKLQDLQKPFDLMTYPGGKHGLIRQSGPGLHAHREHRAVLRPGMGAGAR